MNVTRTFAFSSNVTVLCYQLETPMAFESHDDDGKVEVHYIIARTQHEYTSDGTIVAPLFVFNEDQEDVTYQCKLPPEITMGSGQMLQTINFNITWPKSTAQMVG